MNIFIAKISYLSFVYQEYECYLADLRSHHENNILLKQTYDDNLKEQQARLLQLQRSADDGKIKRGVRFYCLL